MSIVQTSTTDIEQLMTILQTNDKVLIIGPSCSEKTAFLDQLMQKSAKANIDNRTIVDSKEATLRLMTNDMARFVDFEFYNDVKDFPAIIEYLVATNVPYYAALTVDSILPNSNISGSLYDLLSQSVPSSTYSIEKLLSDTFDWIIEINDGSIVVNQIGFDCIHDQVILNTLKM